MGMGWCRMDLQLSYLHTTRHFEIHHSLCAKRKGLEQSFGKQGNFCYRLKITEFDFLIILMEKLCLDGFYNKEGLWERRERSTMGSCTKDSTWSSTSRNNDYIEREEQL